MRKNKDYCLMEDIEEVSSSSVVEDEILNKLRNENISQCVFLLRPAYREVIVLYYYEGLPIKKICEILDEKENTLKSKLKRGRDLLKIVIEKEGNIL
jgi:RNA polymerase sigma-70 factor (ECF subfamily)